MEIDACTFEDPKPGSFHEDANKQLPYSLTAEKQYQREVTLEEDAICYIPSKPLLLLYKIKAARDRAYDLKTKGTTIEPTKAERLRKNNKRQSRHNRPTGPKPKQIHH